MPQDFFDLLQRLGFKEVGTGGGCTAWQLGEDDAHILITDQEGMSTDIDTKPLIGFYINGELLTMVGAV